MPCLRERERARKDGDDVEILLHRRGYTFTFIYEDMLKMSAVQSTLMCIAAAILGNEDCSRDGPMRNKTTIARACYGTMTSIVPSRRHVHA